MPDLIDDVKERIKKKLKDLMSDAADTIQKKPSPIQPLANSSRQGFMMKKYGNTLIQGARGFNATSESLKKAAGN